MNHHLSLNIKRCSAKLLGLRVFTTRLGLENKTQPREKGRRGPRIPPSASVRVRAQDAEKPSSDVLLLPSVPHTETGPMCFPRKRGHSSVDHHPRFPNRGNPISQDGNDLGNQTRAGMGCNIQAEQNESLGLLTRDLAEGKVTSTFRF